MIRFFVGLGGRINDSERFGKRASGFNTRVRFIVEVVSYAF